MLIEQHLPIFCGFLVSELMLAFLLGIVAGRAAWQGTFSRVICSSPRCLGCLFEESEQLDSWSHNQGRSPPLPEPFAKGAALRAMVRGPHVVAQLGKIRAREGCLGTWDAVLQCTRHLVRL